MVHNYVNCCNKCLCSIASYVDCISFVTLSLAYHQRHVLGFCSGFSNTVSTLLCVSLLDLSDYSIAYLDPKQSVF